MAGDPHRVMWSTLTGAETCSGCERRIEIGRRALRFQGAGRAVDRLAGLWFHGFDCLARRAEISALEEDDRGSRRGDAYRDVERWAAGQERARRAAGRV